MWMNIVPHVQFEIFSIGSVVRLMRQEAAKEIFILEKSHRISVRPSSNQRVEMKSYPCRLNTYGRAELTWNSNISCTDIGQDLLRSKEMSR